MAWGFIKPVTTQMSLELIKKIHKRLMSRLNIKIAGKLRQVQVGVQTKEGFKEAVNWALIRGKLEELCKTDPKTEEEIKQWHIKFEKIHPFEDGNGRTGRIIMNHQRLRAVLPLLIIHEGKEQHEYYQWFGN